MEKGKHREEEERKGEAGGGGEISEGRVTGKEGGGGRDLGGRR